MRNSRREMNFELSHRILLSEFAYDHGHTIRRLAMAGERVGWVPSRVNMAVELPSGKGSAVQSINKPYLWRTCAPRNTPARYAMCIDSHPGNRRGWCRRALYARRCCCRRRKAKGLGGGSLIRSWNETRSEKGGGRVRARARIVISLIR